MTGLSRLRSWTLLSLGFCPNPGEKIRAFHLGPLQGYANRRFFEFVVPIAVRLLQRERTGLEGKIIHRDRHKKSIRRELASVPREFLEAFSREGRRIGSRILQHPAMGVS